VVGTFPKSFPVALGLTTSAPHPPSLSARPYTSPQGAGVSEWNHVWGKNKVSGSRGGPGAPRSLQCLPRAGTLPGRGGDQARAGAGRGPGENPLPPPDLRPRCPAPGPDAQPGQRSALPARASARAPSSASRPAGSAPGTSVPAVGPPRLTDGREPQAKATRGAAGRRDPAGGLEAVEPARAPPPRRLGSCARCGPSPRGLTGPRPGPRGGGQSLGGALGARRARARAAAAAASGPRAAAAALSRHRPRRPPPRARPLAPPRPEPPPGPRSRRRPPSALCLSLARRPPPLSAPPRRPPDPALVGLPLGNRPSRLPRSRAAARGEGMETQGPAPLSARRGQVQVAVAGHRALPANCAWAQMPQFLPLALVPPGCGAPAT
jgi:hypothetical protein